ncbi:hypothetical protein C7M84_014950 [Penaeus vannamei]|uniref:Uncharacterized protein n=1 Tax=Penaeus vannamei TaxID=6689 RepID=A0A3R7PHT6_PENVA|nr:hypothetical protein C7M84_014950 [Penaeus vannamei]
MPLPPSFILFLSFIYLHSSLILPSQFYESFILLTLSLPFLISPSSSLLVLTSYSPFSPPPDLALSSPSPSSPPIPLSLLPFSSSSFSSLFPFLSPSLLPPLPLLIPYSPSLLPFSPPPLFPLPFLCPEQAKNTSLFKLSLSLLPSSPPHPLFPFLPLSPPPPPPYSPSSPLSLSPPPSLPFFAFPSPLFPSPFRTPSKQRTPPYSNSHSLSFPSSPPHPYSLSLPSLLSFSLFPFSSPYSPLSPFSSPISSSPIPPPLFVPRASKERLLIQTLTLSPPFFSSSPPIPLSLPLSPLLFLLFPLLIPYSPFSPLFSSPSPLPLSPLPFSYPEQAKNASLFKLSLSLLPSFFTAPIPSATPLPPPRRVVALRICRPPSVLGSSCKGSFFSSV